MCHRRHRQKSNGATPHLKEMIAGPIQLGLEVMQKGTITWRKCFK